MRIKMQTECTDVDILIPFLRTQLCLISGMTYTRVLAKCSHAHAYINTHARKHALETRRRNCEKREKAISRTDANHHGESDLPPNSTFSPA